MSLPGGPFLTGVSEVWFLTICVSGSGVIRDSISNEAGNRVDKPERLFRSAIEAYCSIVRPTKRDAAQLDDLTLPLLPLVSPEGRRFAAAALSETGPQATALVRRLAEEPIEISAPLLTRSVNLSDVDLIGIIGRHGIGHAQAIGKRAHLNANIAKVIKVLGAMERSAEQTDIDRAETPAAETPKERPASAYEPETGAAEAVRVELREMMTPSRQQETAPSAERFAWPEPTRIFAQLLSTALTGTEAFFHTTIADALDIKFGAAQLLEEEDAPGLSTVLRSFDLSVEQAFLIATLAYPYGAVGHEAVRSFVDDYRKLELKTARASVSAWREWQTRVRQAVARDWEPIADQTAANDATAARNSLRAS